MSLTVLEAGSLATVQDLGRFGFQRFGVPTSGAMDGLAIRAANELVCNPWNAACLEIGLGGLVVTTTEPSVIAVTGRGVGLIVGDRPLRTVPRQLGVQAGSLRVPLQCDVTRGVAAHGEGADRIWECDDFLRAVAVAIDKEGGV